MGHVAQSRLQRERLLWKNKIGRKKKDNQTFTSTRGIFTSLQRKAMQRLKRARPAIVAADFFYGFGNTPLILTGGMIGGLPDPVAASSAVSFDYRVSKFGTHYIAEVTMDTATASNSTPKTAFTAFIHAPARGSRCPPLAPIRMSGTPIPSPSASNAPPPRTASPVALR